PAPAVVEALSFETIFAAMLADLRARDPAFTALVESDPAYKILEVAAYRELLVRQRVNDAARRVMLAYAAGADLEHLAALYGVTRAVVDPGDPGAVPPVPPLYETDERLRHRVQQAPEALSTAGPVGAYEFHAFSASGAVADVDVASPAPGEVVVTVLSALENGVPSPELLELVEAAVNARDVRPLTDQVTVQAAAVLTYAVEAVLYLYSGPDPEVVRQAAADAATAYAAEHFRLGHDITLSGLYAALHRPGVQRVELTSPAATLVVEGHQAARASAIAVTIGGTDE
ncbi:MAG: baseplate J/gp47 family protein, partial [Thermodesulfobacteriota bacterium]